MSVLGESAVEEPTLTFTGSVSAGEESGFSEPGSGSLGSGREGRRPHALTCALWALAVLVVSMSIAEWLRLCSPQRPACLPANQGDWSWDLQSCWGPQGLG